MRAADRDDEREVIIRETGHGIGPFLTGLALGAVVALLFAPQSGEETRREIGKRAERARRRAMRAAEDIGEVVSDRFENVKDYVEDEIDTARRAVERKKRQVVRAVEAGREAARETREELERRVAETKAAFVEAGEEGTPRSRKAADRGDSSVRAD
jgi:gas vesicle protein